MKNIKNLVFVVLITIGFSSCEKEIFRDFLQSDLTDEEIADGLKEALKVGTDTASGILGKTDGYFRDQAVKILLPDELENRINEFKSKEFDVGLFTITGQDLYDGYSNDFLNIDVPSLKSKEDELILGINRAAESAASEAAPIFVNAITGMTIYDAKNILFTEDTTAATTYLKGKTYDGLYSNYEPQIDDALNSVTINEQSVVEVYEDYVNRYNSIVNTSVATSTIGDLMNVKPIEATDISAYATKEGLDGLFLKVSEEEAAIRENPLARVTDILEKVFGELDNHSEY